MGRRIDYLNDPAAPTATTLVPSVNVGVRNDAGELLLIRRTDNDNWAMPGGSMDIGETIAEAGLRETREETGINCEIVGLVGVYTNPEHVMLYTSNGEVRQECSLVFAARSTGGELTPSSESSEVRWVSEDELEHYPMHQRCDSAGRLKDYAKTAGSRRAVPLRARVVAALEPLTERSGVLFPAPQGGRMEINNFRHRSWTPSLAAAGIAHRRTYDLRHTYATWSLVAGVDIFTLARRMGTSVKMIDRTYGHLVGGADAYERELLDAFDAVSRAVGRPLDGGSRADAA
jgi:ADP-ribose pyrophosphatase YjhB (NUDIX family)